MHARDLVDLAGGGVARGPGDDDDDDDVTPIGDPDDDDWEDDDDDDDDEEPLQVGGRRLGEFARCDAAQNFEIGYNQKLAVNVQVHPEGCPPQSSQDDPIIGF